MSYTTKIVFKMAAIFDIFWYDFCGMILNLRKTVQDKFIKPVSIQIGQM